MRATCNQNVNAVARLKYLIILRQHLACFKYKEQEFSYCDNSYVINDVLCDSGVGGEWQTRTTETDT